MYKKLPKLFVRSGSAELRKELLKAFLNDQKVELVSEIQKADLVLNLDKDFAKDREFLRSLIGRVLISGRDFAFAGALNFDLEQEEGEFIAYGEGEFDQIVALVKAFEVFEFAHDWRSLVNNLASFLEENFAVSSENVAHHPRR